MREASCPACGNCCQVNEFLFTCPGCGQTLQVVASPKGRIVTMLVMGLVSAFCIGILHWIPDLDPVVFFALFLPFSAILIIPWLTRRYCQTLRIPKRLNFSLLELIFAAVFFGLLMGWVLNLYNKSMGIRYEAVVGILYGIYVLYEIARYVLRQR